MTETDDTADLDARLSERLTAYDPWRVGLYAVLAALVGFYLIPIETGIVTSIKTATGVVETLPYVPPGPSTFTLQNWATAFDLLVRGIVNSLIFTIPATILCAILGSTAAYGLTLVDWRGQIGVLVLFIAGIFIPYQAVIVPLSRFWSNYLDLTSLLSFLWALPVLEPYWGTLIELTITHVAYGIPICVLLFRSHYKSISTEMLEAARLDGASVTKIYYRIVLPLSRPMFAVVLIFQFTQIWNEFLFSLTLVSSASSPAASVTLILSGIGEAQTGLDFPLRMAAAFVAAIPTILIYVLFTDEFAEGVRT
ncbi:carbohydrate ABC transporter permease [Halobacterium zhouii]|uniref:carbohydrate ABC transporter permease n=1 Tax=Halobacterium zhouii TaxID=2902624 RepID=UPI001E3D9C9A|nr:carbohydrate ABC transporter permease [Halobacterium zhouii]